MRLRRPGTVLLSLAVSSIIPSFLTAQGAEAPKREAWSLSTEGQVRVRSETWSDFGAAPEKDDTFLLLRLLASADLHAGEHVRAYVKLRSALSTDRNLPGGRRGLDADNLDLQDAFVDLVLPLASGTVLTARAGRQGLLFGKQRLVSPLDWANTQRTFDGVTAIASSGHLSVRGFWAQPVRVRKTDFNRSDAGQNLFGVYLSQIPTTGSLGFDLYWLGLDRDSTSVNGTSGHETRHTLGGRLRRTRATGLAFDAETAYQFGRLGGETISAFMLASELSYGFGGPLAPRARAGIDFASGDGEPGGSVGTFDQLFPLGHAYLGFADVVGRRNSIGLSAGGGVRPTESLTLRLTGHHLMRSRLDDGLYNAGGRLSRGPADSRARVIGNEIDVTARHRISGNLSAVLGYSRFFAGQFLEDTGAAADSDFLYLSASFDW